MRGVLIIEFPVTDQDAVMRVSEAVRPYLPGGDGVLVHAAIGPSADYVMQAFARAPGHIRAGRDAAGA
jgi:hypothetical protein